MVMYALSSCCIDAHPVAFAGPRADLIDRFGGSEHAELDRSVARDPDEFPVVARIVREPGLDGPFVGGSLATRTKVFNRIEEFLNFNLYDFGTSIGNLKVRRLFTKARNMSDKYGGAVIFIDEIDAVGARGGVSDRSAPREGTDRFVMGAGMNGGGGMGVINELLVQMDGFTVPRGLWRHVRRIVLRSRPKVPFYNILVIAATNRASSLDPALLRPGRFDRKIHVGLPDSEGREDIARYYLAKVRHEPIDFSKLARMTVGYSPAMIKNIVNEALLFALQDGRDALRWDDLWQAKLTEEIGLKQPVKYSDREKEMVAVHEAGHAVTSYALQRGERQIQVITIQKRESALGLVSSQAIEEMYLSTQKQLLAQVQVSLAGLVAEEIWFGQTTSGPSSDLVNATRIAAVYVGLYGMGRSLVSVGAAGGGLLDGDPIGSVIRDPDRRREMDAILDDCRTRVRGLLTAKRSVVEGVRDALLVREELIGDEIEALMADLGEREPLDVEVPVLPGAPAHLPAGPSGNGVGGANAPRDVGERRRGRIRCVHRRTATAEG